MDVLTSKIVWMGALFLFVFLSGLWLNRSGRPINPIKLTLHKLIALATLILLGVTVTLVNQVTPLSAAAIAATVITGILFVATITAGGLISLAKPVSAMSIVHKVGPFLTVTSTIVTLVLLVNPLQ